MNGACAAAAILRHLAEQLDVGRAVVEVVVADQAAERLAAELAVLLFVDLLEERALVPGRALVTSSSVLPSSFLRDVHDADLQHLVGLGVVDQVVQAAPRAFQLLEVVVVQDQVDLLGQLLVDLRR